MKIGIVCFWDRTATPYLDKYETILSENHIEYESILWDRGKETTPKPNDVIVSLPISKKLIFKVFNFFQWRKKLISILRTKKYDKLIILTTVPGILLRNYLKRYYKNQYIFDIRDYTLEKIAMFRRLTENVIDNSYFSTISSKGFYQWLDKSAKIIPNHNLTYNHTNSIKLPDFSQPIIEFGFVGNVRLDKQTRDVLLKLKNSKRYISSFYGRIMPHSDIVDFVSDNKITNTKFSGEFTLVQKPFIYQNIHLINAVYANSNSRKNYADSTPLPNRIYDCVVFKRPIIASKNTYLSDLVEKYNLGISVNGSTDDIEMLFDRYINNFNEIEFIKGCQLFINEVLIEEDIFKKHIEDFIK